MKDLFNRYDDLLKDLFNRYDDLFDLPENTLLFDDPRVTEMFHKHHGVIRKGSTIYVVWHDFANRMVFTKFYKDGGKVEVSLMTQDEANEHLAAYKMEQLL